MNNEKVLQLIDAPETIAALERAALRDVLTQIDHGDGEQIATRRRVGELVSLLMEDIRQRQQIIEELQRRQMILSTMQNYMVKMRANWEAKQAAEAQEG
jgi:hypothetical protein